MSKGELPRRSRRCFRETQSTRQLRTCHAHGRGGLPKVAPALSERTHVRSASRKPRNPRMWRRTPSGRGQGPAPAEATARLHFSLGGIPSNRLPPQQLRCTGGGKRKMGGLPGRRSPHHLPAGSFAGCLKRACRRCNYFVFIISLPLEATADPDKNCRRG